MNNTENKELHPKTKKVLEISKKRKQKTLTNSECDNIEIFNSNDTQTPRDVRQNKV